MRSICTPSAYPIDNLEPGMNQQLGMSACLLHGWLLKTTDSPLASRFTAQSMEGSTERETYQLDSTYEQKRPNTSFVEGEVQCSQSTLTSTLLDKISEDTLLDRTTHFDGIHQLDQAQLLPTKHAEKRQNLDIQDAIKPADIASAREQFAKWEYSNEQVANDQATESCTSMLNRVLSEFSDLGVLPTDEASEAMGVKDAQDCHHTDVKGDNTEIEQGGKSAQMEDIHWSEGLWRLHTGA